ncbi:MAG: glycosyltransferase [Actinomycetota bacterium]
MKRAALYICYYHITDPLVESQVVAYLRELSARGIEMHLLTFEKERLSAERRTAIAARLAAAGIQWHTLRYHQRPSLPATLYDVAAGALASAQICRRHSIRFIHARSHVPAAMALLLKRFLGCRFLFDLRGLMAEEYLDAGRWSENDLKFRLTKRMERVFFREADALVMLTHRIKADLSASEPALARRNGGIQVIPCCVDLSRFEVSDEQREEYRRQRAWTDRKVLVYLGKVGTWYRPEAMAGFFRALREREPRSFFQILTQDDPTPMLRALSELEIDPADFDLRYSPPSELPLVLSAADAAISFRAGESSKRAASPTKVGECLAAGLPVVTNSGIGDCDEMLSGARVGVVLCDFTETEYERAATLLLGLINASDVRSRCRDYASAALSLHSVGAARYAGVYEAIFSSAASPLEQPAPECNQPQ